MKGQRRGKGKRHHPERSCLACREPRTKGELIRVVRVPNGTVEVDREGRRPGRGAYLCLSEGCWEAGLKGSRLEHSLHLPTSLPLWERARLAEEGKILLSQAGTHSLDNN